MTMRAEITGQRFGWLTAECALFTRNQRRYWLCRCDCGAPVITTVADLRDGNTSSCGCRHREVSRALFTKHGMTHSAECRAWRHAKERCYNPNTINYERYGGRGITMCAEWRENFAAFFAEVGPRPPGTILDRINNDKGYEPGNVRWVTPKQSAQNRRWPPQRKPKSVAISEGA